MERTPVFQSREAFQSPELENIANCLDALDRARMYTPDASSGRDMGDEHPDPKDPLHNQISPEKFQIAYAPTLRNAGFGVSLESSFSDENTYQKELLLTLEDTDQLKSFLENTKLPLVGEKDRRAFADLVRESLATLFSSLPGTGREEYFYDMVRNIRPLAEIAKECAGDVYKEGDALAITAYQVNELLKPLKEGYLNEYVRARELHFFDLDNVTNWCRNLSLDEYSNRLEEMYAFIVDQKSNHPLFADQLALQLSQSLAKVAELGNSYFPMYPDSFRRRSKEFAQSLSMVMLPQESFASNQGDF
ncbi:MAG: hypothetical protein K9M36_01315 [Candidatus Pacebacteria bacterium]|nr:hypothetical protein [Candidatus Paceibacterota bacterium]